MGQAAALSLRSAQRGGVFRRDPGLKDTLDLAKHIVNQKSGRFRPENFEDHYEHALVDLINRASRSRRRSGRVARTSSI